MDFKNLNERLIQFIEKYTMVNSPIANKYGNPEYIPVNTMIGNYKITDSRGWDLIISQQIKQYLLEVSQLGGYGSVTSCMDGNHAGSPGNPRSHYSGNKVDIGLGDCAYNKEEIIQRSIPFLLHPATLEFSLEAIHTSQDSIQSSKDVIGTILKQYPEIQDRINNKTLNIPHWGTQYSKWAHIDILINPEKLKFD